MGSSLAVSLQAAFFMQMILSYCPVVFVVCKKMINICAEYGACWDIKFNSAKGHCISFGGCEPSTFTITLNDSPVQLVHKFKYLSCFLGSPM